MPDPASAPAPTFLPIDLQHFLNAVLLAAETEGGFGLDDVERVEEAWQIADIHLMSHGYIVGLATGQRIYLEYIEDNTAGDGTVAEEIEIVPLEPGMERPDLEGGAQGIFWYQATHITEYLTAQRSGAAVRH